MRNSNTFPDRILQWRRLRGWVLAALSGICLVKAACPLDPAKAMSQYVRDRWGAERGFLGGAVYAICESADGYLWIGAERGLVRFDGFNFSLIQRPLPDEPPIGAVRGLACDEQGNLWIRLDGPHFLLYRDGKFEDAMARFDLQDNAFTAMALDYEGGLLLSGLGNRALRYRQGKFETIANSEDVPGTIISIAETRDHRVWLGTRDEGLFVIDKGRISTVTKQLADIKVNALLPAHSGGLWIGTDDGIEFWDVNGLTKTRLPHATTMLQVLSMAMDHDGNAWAGTNDGLVRITRAGGISLDRPTNKPDDAVTAVYEDRDGDLWFADSQGIQRLRDGIFTSYSVGEGLPSDTTGPIYADSDGRIWFAPLSGGLFWLEGGRVGHIALAGLDSDVVYSISGGGGEIWIGRQHGGLTVLTRAGGSFAARTYTQAEGLAQNSVYSVHLNRDGTVWAGTVSAGVTRLKDGVFTTYSVANGLPSNAVNSIVEGFGGKTWFATPNGLACFADGGWTNRSAGLPSPNVRTIFEDSSHVLWIATSGGLAFFSSGHLEAPHNLPEALREQIFGIAEGAHGSLWISTSDHVLQVNRDRLLSGSLAAADVHSYGTVDGLRGAEGVRRDRSMVADALGQVWVSLNRGLAVADAKITPGNIAPVAVRIESVSVGGVQVDLENSPKIAAGSQSVTFNYAGNSLSAPDGVRFRYKLDGSDQGWSDIVASRQVIYTHLGPGAYRFRVVASSAAGLWNGAETIVPFVIEPAYWQTWWFRTACLTVCLLLVAALYRLRMYQLTRRLNFSFQERLAERTRIAQELHDTLLQGYLGASMQLDVAEDQLPDDSPTKPLLTRALQLMRQVNEEGRNALRGLRTLENDSRGLELAFSRVRQEFAVDAKIGYRVIATSSPRPLRPLIRDEVYRIGREALVNAFLHARPNSVEVEVEYASKYLRIVVRDDGCGIDPHVLHAGREGHWGLPGMRERSESIGGRLKLRSRIGAGTEVELTVPGSVAFEHQSRGTASHWLAWLNREKFENTAGSEEKRRHK